MIHSRERIALGGLARAATVPAAAFAVHQLRFVLAFGGGANAELARTGHSHLHSLVPWIVLLVGLSAGGFLWMLGRAAGGGRSRSQRAGSFLVLWLACALCLVAIYCAQEFLEGLFATGHPTGLPGIFGFGGWWAVPATIGVGLVLAALFQGVAWTLDEVARRRRSAARRRHSARVVLLPKPRAAWRPQLAPVLGGWSDRGPPQIS